MATKKAPKSASKKPAATATLGKRPGAAKKQAKPAAPAAKKAAASKPALRAAAAAKPEASCAAMPQSLGLVRVLRDDGSVLPGADPKLPVETMLFLYEQMVQVREFDRRMLMLQRQGRIGFYLQSTGQEASHLGAAYALKDSDWLFPAYRQPGILLLRQVPIDKIVCEWFGNAGDTSKGRQMPVHYSFRQANFVSISSPIGTQLTQAAGAGMAARIRGDDTVFMTFCGDGGTSSNDFHTGLNFAAVYKAPVVFVCENNGWAISVPSSKQTCSESMAIKADAYGVPSVRIDGNDVLAVYGALRTALARARAGGGPTFIESVTYRIGAHSTSDDPTRYRSQDEVDEWMRRDPLARLRAHLEHRGLVDEASDDVLERELNAEIAAAIQAVESAPAPARATLFDDVYADLPWHLREQRRELLEGPVAPPHP